MRKTISILFCLTMFCVAGQDSTSISEITNRLGRTRSSKAIPKGEILANVNYSYIESSIHYYESLKRNMPGVSFGYGLNKWMDLRLAIGYSFYKESEYYGATPQSWIGLSHLKLGSKFNLFQQKGWIPQMAFSLDLVLSDIHPQYDKDRFYSGTGFVLSLPWSYRLGQKFRLGGGFEYMYTQTFSSKSNPHLFNGSVNGRYEFLRGGGMFIDLIVPTNFTYYSITPTIGAYYRINASMQLDVSFGKLTEMNNPYSYERNHLSGGFSWLMGNN